jgi:hypothetical protein
MALWRTAENVTAMWKSLRRVSVLRSDVDDDIEQLVTTLRGLVNGMFVIGSYHLLGMSRSAAHKNFKKAGGIGFVSAYRIRTIDVANLHRDSD